MMRAFARWGSVVAVLAMVACSPAPPDADQRARPPISEPEAFSGGCNDAFASFMNASGNKKKALFDHADATLESCTTLAAWTRANRKAGAGNIGSPAMMASLFCADYQRRIGAPPQPICSEAAQATGQGFRKLETVGKRKAKSLLEGLIKRHRPE